MTKELDGHKNFKDVTAAALCNTHKDDEFTQLIISAPTVDITNLDTSKIAYGDNIEALEQNVLVSCLMFSVAQTALAKHPKLERVVILEHTQRFVNRDTDPMALKPYLARFANTTLLNLLQTSTFKNKIQIGKYNHDCPEDKIKDRYTDEKSQQFDGFHMYGFFGRRAFTRSLQDIISRSLTSPDSTPESNTAPKMSSTNNQPRYHS